VKRTLVAFGAGVVFAIGLAISGMTTPAKVAGFLDFTGAWDPSLAFVMVGAIGVYLPLQWIARRREKPLLAPRFVIPAEKPIDARLIGGAAIFGIGWGAAGYCPGPAVASLGTGSLAPWIFTAGMIAGFGIFEIVRASASRDQRSATKIS
jgi:uncharacterized protein